jgi:hypothetical protein
MRGIDVFYQLRYFLSLNAMNAYIQGRREYLVSKPWRHTTTGLLAPPAAFAAAMPLPFCGAIDGLCRWPRYPTTTTTTERQSENEDGVDDGGFFTSMWCSVC